MGKFGLTKALEELTTLLPKALECCPAEPESQSSNLIIEKLRNVLLDLLSSCEACSTGKHIVAVLRIMKLVLDKLPAAFVHGAHYTAAIHMVQLLGRLPSHVGTIDDQLLAVWCSMAGMLADQEQQLLLELHAGTVDLLLDLEQVLFELCVPRTTANHASLQLMLYQGLLSAAQLAGRQQQQQQHADGSQEAGQQQAQQQAVQMVKVAVQDEHTWKAYVSLGLQLMLYMLEECPTLLGPLTPCALVPALGQILSYSSSQIQELCMNVMTLMVVQQSHEVAMAGTVLQHVLWLLECAMSGQIPADVCSASWQVAAAACVTSCTSALASAGMLEAYADRLITCYCSAITTRPLSQQHSLWLGLLNETLQLSPRHAAIAALHLPMVLPYSSDAVLVGVHNGHTTDSTAAEALLLQAWQAIGRWTATLDVLGIVDRQMMLLQRSFQPASVNSVESASDVGNSPKKKKRKLKQAQLTAEGGLLGSQRPGKGSSSQPSDSDKAPATAANSNNGQLAAAQLAVQTMLQQLQLQPAAADAAAVARIAGLIACLGPSAPVPVELSDALQLHRASDDKTGADAGVGTPCEASQHDQQDVNVKKIRALHFVLQGVMSVPGQSAALVAFVACQVVAWLLRVSGQPDLCSELLPSLLLAMLASAASAAAEPAAVELHMAVWQQARDSLQGANSIYNSGTAGPPSPLLAATSIAWLTLSRLLGWGGSAAVSAASAQIHAGSTSTDPACAVAAVLLLPFLGLLQHAQFDDLPQQTPGATPVQTGPSKQQQLQQFGHVLKLGSGGCQQVLSSFMQSVLGLAVGFDAPPVQLAAIKSVSVLLLAHSGPVHAITVAAWLQDAADMVLSIHGRSSCRGSAAGGLSSKSTRGRLTQKLQLNEAVLSELLDVLGPYHPPVLAKHAAAGDGSSAAAAVVLPALAELMPVLHPAVLTNSSNANSGATMQVQAAALQLLNSYLKAVDEHGPVTGSKQLLLDALQLVTSAVNVVRDAALELVQQYLQPAVLHEAFPSQRLAHRSSDTTHNGCVHTGEAAESARLLLQHLRQVTASAGGTTASQQQQRGKEQGGSVAAQLSLLRVVAGMYEGFVNIGGCAELPLLYLLEQVMCQHAQVSATALELLQHLAVKHTSSKELEELLIQGPAGAALLTAVGRALATQPELFTQLASLVQVPENQLAAAVATDLVPWLCQQQLKEPLELLAAKLAVTAGQLVLRSSDTVLAERLWHNPDGLASYMEFVETTMKPHTFLDAVNVMGRRMTRCIIYKAGSGQFWGSQLQPPRELLARAKEYVGIVANGMELTGPEGFAELLQGETIALLLKHIGNTLSKDVQAVAGAADKGSRSPAAVQAVELGCEALQQVIQPILQQHDDVDSNQPGLFGAVGGSSKFVSVADKMQCLRTLSVLMHLLGEHLGTHAYQMMAVLSESLLYCTEGSLQMQALAAWLSFVQLLAAHSPAVLQCVAAQAAVVLLPVLEFSGQEGSASTAAVAKAAGSEAAVAASGVSGEVDAAAVKLAAMVLHEIVVRQRQHVQAALRNMPPLPSMDVLKEVNAVLAQEQHCQGPLQQLQLLINALQHESIAVRHVGLGEVRSFLSQQKSFISDAMSGLLSCSGPAALPQDGSSSSASGAGSGQGSSGSKWLKKGKGNGKLAPVQCRELFSELLAALLASCDNLPRMGQNSSQAKLVQSMKQRCAQCLGLLGAIDPAHVRPELPRPAPFAYRAEACLVPLIQQHLIRVLQTACDIGQLEVTSYAIQHLLQHYNSYRLQRAASAMKSFSVQGFEAGLDAQQKKDKQQAPPSEDGSIFSYLDDNVKSIVKPFLTTRFFTQTRQPERAAIVFGSHAHTFRRWLHLWLKQISSHTTGPLAAAFEACRGVTAWDMPLMMFMLPYMMAEAAGQSEEGLQMIVSEIAAIMECAADPESHIADIELYVQCIFTQLDLLQKWLQEQQLLFEKVAERTAQAQAQAAAAAGNRQAQLPVVEVQLPPFVANVQSLITAIPIETRAQAALRCGSFARALQYYETFVRDKYGGGLNVAAHNGGCTSYDYDDVSFLLEVYGQLEEPDGLAGLVQLRQGGLTTSDQILVAEKAGAWSEALSLYELALSQEAAAATERAAASSGRPTPADAAGSVSIPAVRTAGDALVQAACAIASGSKLKTDTFAGQKQQLLFAAGPDSNAAAAGAAYQGLSNLQVGQLKCLLQMGHHQTLLRQVDGLLTKCLNSSSPNSPHALHAEAATLSTLNPAGLNTTELQGIAAGGQQWWVTQLAALGLAAAWRLGAWGVLRGYLSIIEAAAAANVRPLSSADQWEVSVGTLLEAAQRGAYPDVLAGVANERAGVLGLLPAIAGESYARSYQDLLKLHMLQELEDACCLLQKPQPVGPLVRGRTLRWQERLQLTAPLLSCREPVLALRRQLAGLMADAEAMGKCWLQHAKLCRSTGHQEAAETSVLEAQARAVPGALLERCKLLWDRDKGHRAVMELQLAVQQALDSDVQSDDPSLQHQRAKEMLQLTEWMAAVGQGHKDVLRANYEDAIQLDTSWEKAHFSYAVYLDDLYRDAKLREGKPATSKGMDRLGGRSRVRTQEDSPLDYLPQALEHYGESIRVGHKHILQSLPRLLTLYFEFGSKVASSKGMNQKLRNAHTQVSGVMRGLVRNIPTYKWLLVLPQLTSRICHPQQDVQDFMQTLLGAIVDHFPQQALWSMAMVCKSTVRARQEAASTILNQAKRRSGESGKLLFENFTRLTDQLIKACMWQPPSDKRMSRCSGHKEFKYLVGLLPLDIQVPVQALFTVDLPPGGKLPPGHRPVSSQTTLAGMKDEVLIMSSLMKPKKITFIGSDGLEYPFLAKPKDDLRKDYRLMDFAGTLNALLARQPQALRRGLSLRTYAVLPLTDDCGILQWVNNLVPFKSACEEIYAKEKLYSRHSTPMQIKKMYDSFSGGSRAQLLDRVLAGLPPRLGKWLLAKFPEPGTWLAARLAFTRTNAAWAMVGHVLGLGDRHGDNIMINGLTGETMHVDFGCLFDKGLTLEVPEMVPFRLTQNVVDAFGVSGVEGAFRRAAEMTLQVLRDNKATLMTCAETFLHDPLVDWARVKTSGSSAAASGAEAGENPMAKDALFVMEGRLSGTMLGVAAVPSLPLSCEGQAARLIEEASDHENLGKMYIWWMPWL